MCTYYQWSICLYRACWTLGTKGIPGWLGKVSILRAKPYKDTQARPPPRWVSEKYVSALVKHWKQHLNYPFSTHSRYCSFQRNYGEIHWTTVFDWFPSLYILCCRSPAAGSGRGGGKITLGQQLLFCAQGLAGVASKGKQPPPPILADLSKQWLVTRADTGALGQTHPSPIQTHDEISLVLDHHRINRLHHVWRRRCGIGHRQWLRHVQGRLRRRRRPQGCLPLHRWTPPSPGEQSHSLTNDPWHLSC